VSVHFAVKGQGKMVSPADMKAEAGVATLLLQAGDAPGHIAIYATAPSLPDAKMTFASQAFAN
jgi:hypothetical protein